MKTFKEMINEREISEKVSSKDNVLDGITFEEIMDTISSNETEVNEKVVMKVYKEILKMRMDDAMYTLKKNMGFIVSW